MRKEMEVGSVLLSRVLVPYFRVLSPGGVMNRNDFDSNGSLYPFGHPVPVPDVFSR